MRGTHQASCQADLQQTGRTPSGKHTSFAAVIAALSVIPPGQADKRIADAPYYLELFGAVKILEKLMTDGNKKNNVSSTNTLNIREREIATNKTQD